MAVRPPQNETDIAPWVLVGSVPVAALAWWLWQVPAVALLWILVVAACWFSQPPILTGKKDRTGRVQPASTAEQKSMSRHEMFRAGRFSLIVPQISSIGWPPLMASFTALLTGVAGWFLPLSAPFQVVWPLFPALNAWGAFVLALQVPAIARQFADDVQPRPGLDVSEVWKRLTSGDLRTMISLGCGVLAAASVVVAGLALGPKFSFLSSLSLGLACVPLCLQVGLHRPVIAHWRDMVDGRAQWAPRWEVLKLDPPPRLVDRSRLSGDVATIDTFDAPPEVGSRGMFARLQDFETLVDPGATVALLIDPNLDSQGQPVPSTSHPTRFRVITWFTDDWPAVSAAETDDDIRQLVIETVASRAAYAVQKLPPLVLEQLAPITDPPSQRDTDDGFDDARAAFGTVWRSPANPDVTVSVLMELGILDRVAAELGCEIIADPENDCAYLGALTEPPIARIQPRWVHRFDELARVRRWDQRWTDIVKRGGRKPVLQPSTEREYQYRHIDRRTGVARSITVGTWGFVTPQGVTPAEFTNQDTEHKLKTTLKAAPFASVQPWKDPASRDGRAHSEAFMVVSVPAGTDLPTLPQDYVLAGRGNEAQRLILAGFLSHAFDACRLARPHLTKLTALTTATSSGTIWRMDIFLGAGVTLDALRKQSEKIRQTLGAEWLIVDRAETGRATIVVGAAPGADGIEYANPADSNREYVTSLNWQQVFIAAKVVSENGAVPSLVSAGVLPHNDRVQDLTFKLPMGLAPADVREKVGKLRAASGNDFIDIRDSETGPDHVRMLVCRENPLPKGVPYDFELVDRLADEGCVPFAMGVEGEPVIFDPKESPHALLSGLTGSGKSVLAQTFIYAAAAHEEHVYIIDPMKGGADFAFVRPYASAFASTITDAAAVLKHIYAEVTKRKDLNAAHGVPSYADLPESVRPTRIWVMVDEFTSLMGKEQVPDPSSDPDEMAERERVIALNSDKATIGTITGKIAREARSAGVTLLLGTQKLSAKLLDTVPGGGDLKVNLARTLLGKASYGDRMSALRNPDDAPELGSFIPKGRGLWEPLVGPTQVIQVWYAPQSDLSEHLETRRSPLRTEELPDLDVYRRNSSGHRLGVLEEDDGTTTVEVVDETPVIEDVGIVEEVDIADDLASFFGTSPIEQTVIPLGQQATMKSSHQGTTIETSSAVRSYDDF